MEENERGGRGVSQRAEERGSKRAQTSMFLWALRKDLG